MWRSASTNSRNRATGASQGIEKRRVMCGFTWVARPRTNRPRTGALELPRLHRHAHRVAGEGEDHVGTQRDPTRGRRGGGDREGRVGDDLGGPDAGEADLLGVAGGVGGADEAAVELSVELHGAAP